MEEPRKDDDCSTPAAMVETEEEPMVGPGPAPPHRFKRPLQFEQAYLDALPSANMFEMDWCNETDKQTQLDDELWQKKKKVNCKPISMLFPREHVREKLYALACGHSCGCFSGRFFHYWESRR